MIKKLLDFVKQIEYMFGIERFHINIKHVQEKELIHQV
jgi:hypothetical protein